MFNWLVRLFRRPPSVLPKPLPSLPAQPSQPFPCLHSNESPSDCLCLPECDCKKGTCNPVKQAIKDFLPPDEPEEVLVEEIPCPPPPTAPRDSFLVPVTMDTPDILLSGMEVLLAYTPAEVPEWVRRVSDLVIEVFALRHPQQRWKKTAGIYMAAWKVGNSPPTSVTCTFTPSAFTISLAVIPQNGRNKGMTVSLLREAFPRPLTDRLVDCGDILGWLSVAKKYYENSIGGR
jgi:hypothetical protein